MSKIIIVPTARTIEAGCYRLELDRKAPLLDAPARKLDLAAKVGIGERLLLEAKMPLDAGSGEGTLFDGKYVFAVADGDKTAAAIGIENFGPLSQPVSYVAYSHLFKPVDLTLGIANGAGWIVRYFAGIDWAVSDSLHLLADYSTGEDDFVSGGFQYEFSEHWGIKSGVEFPRTGSPDVMIKVIFSSRHR